MHRFIRKHGVRVNGISDACLVALRAHDWPGNVRELQNVIERAVILCGDGGCLETEHLGLVPRVPTDSVVVDGPMASAASAGAVAVPVPVPASENGSPVEPHGLLSLAELEKVQILKALERTGGNRTHAAKLLGISIRTLRNKLHEYGRGARFEDPEEGDDADAA
jgi:DNA-binding NtrC family response regulator